MDKIDILLNRGVDKIYPTKEALEKVLRSGKKLRLYQGFDPTGTRLHIGHMVGFRKLAQFAKLGHHVIFLIGDGTGQAGDPSGKTKAREKFFNRKELRENAKDYVMQARKLIDFDAKNVEILYNGDWLNKLTLADILDLMGRFSTQQLLERDVFERRMKKGLTVNYRETIYPLLQGYDSVEMNVDLELGGSDQTFNMLTGRQLVKEMLKKEKFVMTTPLLTDSKGVKIGKTEGNVIGLTDKPEDLYGKIMTLSDDVITKAFEYLTDVPLNEIKNMQTRMEKGDNPMVFKKQLAHNIVAQLNSEKDANAAQKFFEETFQKTQVPTSNIPIFRVNKSKMLIAELLVESGLVKSKSQARRLVKQGAVEINGEKVKTNKLIQIKNRDVIKVGKSRFVKLEVKKE